MSDQSISSDDEDINTETHFVFNGNSRAPCTNRHNGDRKTGNVTPDSRRLFSEEDYYRLLQSHWKKRINKEISPELETEYITLEDVIARTNVVARKSSKSVIKRKYKVKDKREKKKMLKKKRIVPSAATKNQSSASTLPAVSLSSLQKPRIDDTLVDFSIDGADDVKSLKLMRRNCPSFFSLLRDIFLDLPDTTADLDQLERMVRDWQQSPSFDASAWSKKEKNWIDLIPCALKFLAGSGKDVHNCPPYIPMVIFKQKVHQWKWIGTLRDKDSDLVPLFEHWLDFKDNAITGNPPSSAATVIPRTDYVVEPSTDIEKSEYQEQEQLRYENPHKPFIYKMHGFESIVAPVKGVFTKESNLNKAREHSLLVSKRPPYVTILTLVRDAAARLPNGEGTRAEVCLLLKDSQYISPNATDGQIHTVVSGALDRLHYEKDPCVKYDNARKVWIYLHKTRTIEEFEKLHEASAAAARAKKQQNQKQKMIKQQQKVKEAAIIGTADISLAGLNEKPKHEISDNQNAKLVTSNFVSTESTKAKIFNKTKRTPPTLLKKQETKTVPSESMLNSTKDLATLSQSSLLAVSKVDSLPSVQLVRPVLPLPHTKQLTDPFSRILNQDRNVMQRVRPVGNLHIASTLTTPLMNQPEFNRSLTSSSNIGMNEADSSSSADSDTETDSSDENKSIPVKPVSRPQDSSTSSQTREQRLPFNSVMSMFQSNPRAQGRGSSFGGY
ncbi:nuclear factor related to kappa-B-binding protein-like isoform X2 [Xenia sp. Carnegie-2017]|uniref:nuclear factor related to kappa-B-binding protein-like isoform X2 n=1 Tax=Xenia sp. Carnegie-2017 TaxID=2897299 RepID=UPI001F048B2F|nr:nuclear factor related to kappa-B-binding protein-like isoform X2 [Xenia sp. Carnegie-2017]